MIFRSHRDKADLVKSWHRPDRSFFASGACHILAHAFLKQFPNSGFNPIYIRPYPGFRGSHLVVSDGNIVFDYHGYSVHDRFMTHYFIKIRKYWPNWQADLIHIKGSLIGPDFCEQYQHRMPHQFLHDPIPRALSFLKRFPAPREIKSEQPPKVQTQGWVSPGTDDGLIYSTSHTQGSGLWLRKNVRQTGRAAGKIRRRLGPG